MRTTSAQHSLDHDFVDICELLVTAPHVVAPPRLHVASRRLVRRAATDIWVHLEPLEVVTTRYARLRSTWRTSRIHPGLRAGRALVEIEALARPPAARSELTLTVAPLRWGLAAAPGINVGRPRLGDFAQRALRAFAGRVIAELDRVPSGIDRTRRYVDAWLREVAPDAREQQV